MGAVLIGLVQCFRNIEALYGEEAVKLIDRLAPDAWYPISHYFDVIKAVCRYDMDYAPILMRGGTAFIEEWFKNIGHTQIACVSDFLRLQGAGGGYNAVHRGAMEEIGWQSLPVMDESAGYAVIECINPYPKDFELGVFYGGCMLAGDVEWVEVDCTETSYNSYLNKKVYTVQFRYKPSHDISAALDLALEQSTTALTPTPALYEALWWRLRGVESRSQRARTFYKQSNLLLANATEETHQLSRQLNQLAQHDELTGLLNRRALFERCNNLVALNARQGSHLSLIMLDIDHFKSINDTWGHDAGDVVLRRVSEILQTRLRSSDLLGRIGGEEFLLVLPNTDLPQALRLGEELRAAIEKAEVLAHLIPTRALTASFGVSSLSGAAALSFADYVKQADTALYRAKHGGRNCVIAFA